MENKVQERGFVAIFFSMLHFLWLTVQELFWGLIQNRVSTRACYAGFLIALLFYFRADLWLTDSFRFIPKMNEKARPFVIYSAMISGWLFWGLSRAKQRIQLLRKLKSAFEAAKLKCNGQYPALIADLKIDEHIRKLRLHCHGVTKSDFLREVERLESILNISVVRIVQDDDDKSKIEIIYAMKDIEKNPVLENPDDFRDAEIPVGISHEGRIQVNLRDVGHILVAGQTGGGKSNFLKVVTTILTRNNPKAKVLYLDFKGGMETADLRNHAQNLGDNIRCFEGTKPCVEELSRIGTDLEERFKTLSEIGASNFDDYQKKYRKRVADIDETLRAKEEKRTFIVIDEIAQLYSREPGVEKEILKKAQACVNRIARQGRAAGVHLIVATQKPDATSFDQTVKANLPAVLCFPMPNQTASVSALGTKRAFELNPNIKGRAVWKFGPRLEEMQTYLFS